MHGMLSAAILILVFVLITVACGGSVAWLYRASSPSSDYSRSPKASPVDEVADTLVDVPAPLLALDFPEGHALALPAAAEPRELEAPPAREPLESAGTPSEPNAVAGDPGDDQESEGARIYVLDSSRRSNR